MKVVGEREEETQMKVLTLLEKGAFPCQNTYLDITQNYHPNRKYPAACLPKQPAATRVSVGGLHSATDILPLPPSISNLKDQSNSTQEWEIYFCTFCEIT